jgi:type IX secretion system PorP/SprF family membrane protein
MFNMLAVNPGYAGSRDVLSITGLFRQQWTNVDGAPQTFTLSADTPLSSNEKVGLGLQAFRDKLGVTSQTGANFTYAYRVKLGQRSTLGMGLQGGFLNYQVDLTSVRTTTGGDPSFGQNINRFLPNVGAGLYFSNDRLYLGVSCPQFLESNLTNFTPTRVQDSLGVRSQLKRHFFGMFGFVVGLGDNLKMKPSFLVKYVAGAPLSLDANINFWIKDRIAIGGSWRSSNLKFEEQSGGFRAGDAVIGMLELQATDQIRLGYAYDFTINGLNRGGIAGSTHEIMLRYEFGFKAVKILTPRYF